MLEPRHAPGPVRTGRRRRTVVAAVGAAPALTTGAAATSRLGRDLPGRQRICDGIGIAGPRRGRPQGVRWQ